MARLPSIETLQAQYSHKLKRANRLREMMTTQLTELLERGQISLGVPMESRVKTWISIAEKIQRKQLLIPSIQALDDLVGIRLILLFRSDLAAAEKLITDTFDVLSSEDTAKRLGEAQFGYQSQHHVVRLPKPWLEIPSMADLGELKVEIQVRTLAQHIWAAASHKLQYKHEESVPPPLRRTINRASALLEIVDLEFDRVLNEREKYRTVGIPEEGEAEPLNVDNLASVLNETFPPANRHDGNEDYEVLLSDLKKLSVKTVADLRALLKKHYEAAMEDERNALAQRLRKKRNSGTTNQRTEAGVVLTYLGLTRSALYSEFGKRANDVFLQNMPAKARKYFTKRP